MIRAGPKSSFVGAVQRRILADHVVDVALEQLGGLLGRHRDLQVAEHVLDLIRARRADQVLEDRHGMTLRDLGEPIFPDVA